MNATTVNQFAQRCDALAQGIEQLSGNADRVRALAQWLRDQGRARHALHMRAHEFMARCPVAVRDAARAVVTDAQSQLKLLSNAATKPAVPAKKAARIQREE